jgi:hypothetical protein
MNWILVITVVVNGQVLHPDKSKYPTRESCQQVLKVIEQHPMFKEYGGKAVCEKAS